VNTAELERTAAEIVADGKGILAADESTGTMDKRLKAVMDEPTPDARRKFRELMFTTEGASDHIAGAILFDETIRQETGDGKPFVELLSEQGIVPGIKVDTGAKPLAGSPDEKVTEGLDGLRDRLEEYHELGARFAKWRAVITIGDGIPTDYCIDVNAHALARYAALCQEAGIVPIVEPEVLMDGTHTIDTSDEVTTRTLRGVFAELAAQRVALEGILLKPNMVLAAYDCPDQAGAEEVAARTVACLRRAVPAAVPGIVFLSGGQTDEQATENLNAINKVDPQPWVLSFSYGRALQQSALKAWAGEEAKASDAQTAYAQRAALTGAASRGEYSEEMERELAPAG